MSDSASAPIVVHLRHIPQIYEFDHGRTEARLLCLALWSIYGFGEGGMLARVCISESPYRAYTPQIYA